MPKPYILILHHPTIRAALLQAWRDSTPGETGGHEEGGFIVQESTGEYCVLRWPQGKKDVIQVPPHKNCKIGGDEIVASFHTHPNTGSKYLQEPSETDKRAVRDDPNLKGVNYVGEFVISHETIYLVTPEGHIRELGDTSDFLNEFEE
jgi:hypothetical protein